MEEKLDEIMRHLHSLSVSLSQIFSNSKVEKIIFCQEYLLVDNHLYQEIEGNILSNEIN